MNKRVTQQTKWQVPHSSTRGLQSTGAQMTTYIIASKYGNKNVNCDLPGRWRKLKKKSNASIYYTGRKNTESNYSTAGICPQPSEKSWKINGWDWKNFVMPHSNELIAMWELHDLRQGTLSLEESIAKLRILVKEANYPVKRNDRFMRDFLVLGMKSDCVWKDWFKVGNAPHLQGSLWYGKVRRVSRQTASANEYQSVLHQCS